MLVPILAVFTENVLPSSLRLPVGAKRAPRERKPAPHPRSSRPRRRIAADERQQLVQTLHDTACQSVTAAYFSAKFMERKCQGGGPLEAREIAELCEMLHTVVEELQGFTHQLRGMPEKERGGTVTGRGLGKIH